MNEPTRLHSTLIDFHSLIDSCWCVLIGHSDGRNGKTRRTDCRSANSNNTQRVDAEERRGTTSGHSHSHLLLFLFFLFSFSSSLFCVYQLLLPRISSLLPPPAVPSTPPPACVPLLTPVIVPAPLPLLRACAPPPAAVWRSKRAGLE